MYLETLMRLEGASAGDGFSTTSVRMPSRTDRTPYLLTLSWSIVTPRMAESLGL